VCRLWHACASTINLKWNTDPIKKNETNNEFRCVSFVTYVCVYYKSQVEYGSDRDKWDKQWIWTSRVFVVDAYACHDSRRVRDMSRTRQTYTWNETNNEFGDLEFKWDKQWMWTSRLKIVEWNDLYHEVMVRDIRVCHVKCWQMHILLIDIYEILTDRGGYD